MAARELDNDPEQLSLICIPLVLFADAVGVLKRGNKSELDAWQGSKYLEKAVELEMELAREELEKE